LRSKINEPTDFNKAGDVWQTIFDFGVDDVTFRLEGVLEKAMFGQSKTEREKVNIK
jgi:hypothetical protein